MPPPVATFSILGFDPETGEVGGAVQSRVFTLTGVLTADADAGVVATQAIVDVSYGPKGIELLEEGHGARCDHQADLGERSRSGSRSLDQAGPPVRGDEPQGRSGDIHRSKGHDVGGRQTGQVLHGARKHPRRSRKSSTRMVKAFEETKGHLSMRFMAALEAGQAAGGDTRGMQAASMVIVKKGGGNWLNNDTVLRFQVDDQENPYKELRRVVERWNDIRAKSPQAQRPVKPSTVNQDGRHFLTGRHILTGRQFLTGRHLLTGGSSCC